LDATSIKETNPKDALGAAKVPLHLVSPFTKAYLSLAQFLGNVKYGAWNFRHGGARASVYLAALQRHIDRWAEGQELDPVDQTPHLANALACISILIDCKENGNLVDDRQPSGHENLDDLYARIESTMQFIRTKYADKNPRHYTIADTKTDG
jgi:hypothetical protein